MKKLGKYEIVEELGKGAMGVVYKARDPLLGRLVALKTITAGLAEQPELLKRFYREAQAAGGLQHPNIVIIYELGEESGNPYIAMEYLEGENIERIISRQTPLPLSQKLGHIVQVCRALDYAHQRGIVHRDIKPGNIVVLNDGTVKVVDFGIVHLTDTSMTQTGLVIGTVGYMAPEQVRGERVDGRSDLFSLGVVLYEYLSYEKPFTGNNVTEVMLKIIGQDPRPLGELAPQCPPDLQALVQKCLRRDPAERFQSMEELVLELEPLWRRLQREIVSDLVAQGQQLVQSRELLKARDVLRQVLLIDTTHIEAKNLLEKVNIDLKRVVVLPKLEEHVAKGQGLLKRGKLDEARVEGEAALKLDSSYAPALELLEQIQRETDRSQFLREQLRTSKQLLAEGSLTEAELAVAKVLEIDADNPQAHALLKQLQGEKTRREKRKRLLEAMARARNLLIQQNYDECITLLTDLQKQFPSEVELNKLLQTAREEQLEQQKREEVEQEIQRVKALLIEQKFAEAVEPLERALEQFPDDPELVELYHFAKSEAEGAQRRQTVSEKVAEAKNLLAAERYAESLTVLDALLERYPDEPTAKKLRQYVLQEQKEREQRQRLEREVPVLKKLVSEKKYEKAVALGEQLLQELPEEFELARLVEFARSEQAQVDQQRRLKEKLEELQQLLNKGSFAQAVGVAEKALEAFPANAEILRLLNYARAQQKEKDKREFIEKQIRGMKVAIERGDLTDAIDLGRKTLVQVADDTDVTRLLHFAERECELRQQKREKEEQVKTAMFLLGSKKFEEASRVLEELEKTHPFDPQIESLLAAARAQEVPPAVAAPPPAAAPPSTGTLVAAPGEAPEKEYVYQVPSGPVVTPPSAPVEAPQAQAAAPAPTVAPAAARPAVPVAPPKRVVPARAAEVVVPVPRARPFPTVKAGVAAGVVLAIVLGVVFWPRGPSEQVLQQEEGLWTVAERLRDGNNLKDARQLFEQIAALKGRRQAEAEQQVATIQKWGQEDELFTQASELLRKDKLAEARAAFQQVVGIDGRHKQEAEGYITNIGNILAGDVKAKKEKEKFDLARQAFERGQLDRARTLFQEVAAGGGTLKGAAQTQISAIEQLQKEDALIANAQQLINQNRLDEALAALQQVSGARYGQAQELIKDVQKRQEAARLADQENRTIAEARQLMQQGRWAEARSKAEEAIKLQGPQRSAAEGLLRDIGTAEAAANQRAQEDGRFNAAVGRFTQAVQANDRSGLEQTRQEFTQIAQGGGTRASEAREYASNRVPVEISRIQREEQERAAKAEQEAKLKAEQEARAKASTPAQPQPTTPTLAARAAPPLPTPKYPGGIRENIKPGQLLSSEYLDDKLSWVQWIEPSFPAQAGGQTRYTVQLTLEVDENGNVTGVKVWNPDSQGFAEAARAAATGWKLSPPKVKGIPVKTSVRVDVPFGQ